jgi:hypothetical protein
MAGVARHGRRSGAVVVRVVGRVGGQPQRSARVDGDGVVMVLLWRIEDPLRSKQPGADQHAQRKRAHDRDPRPLAPQSAGKPARSGRVGRLDMSVRWGRHVRRHNDMCRRGGVRRRGGVLGGHRRRSARLSRGRLSRRSMGLKLSLLCGSKTSVNAIFHPQPPFSISRRTGLPPAIWPAETLLLGLAGECA